MRGDTNQDGIINTLDIIVIVNHIINEYYIGENSDINNDSNIDVFDIIAIVQIILS